jgi:hypothetical protein
MDFRYYGRDKRMPAIARLQPEVFFARIELNSVTIQFNISSPSTDRGNNGKGRTCRPEER